MVQQGSQIMTPRAYVMWRMDMNLSRQTMQESSENSRIIGRMMATNLAEPGKPGYGWSVGKAIGAICLGDPSVNTLLGRAVREEHHTDSKGNDIPTPALSVHRVISAEMESRRSNFTKLQKMPDSPEWIAFKEDFCQVVKGEDGKETITLIDLEEVDLSKLYLGIEGHHRGMVCYDIGHRQVVSAAKDDPSMTWSNLIPVIPCKFANVADLCEFQTRRNMQDSAVNKPTKLDLIKSGRIMYDVLGTETAFRTFIGETTGTNSRMRSGTAEDDTDADAQAKKDAGSVARFCYNVVKLDRTFPRLDVFKCITADKTDKDFVPLNALSISPKDWEASIPIILTITDRENLEAYIRKYTKNPSPKIVEVYNHVKAGGSVMDLEWVENWWRGRKPNENGGRVRSSLETDSTSKGMDKGQIEAMATSINNVVREIGLSIKRGVYSDEYTWLLDEHNFRPLNAAFDVLKTTPFGRELGELCKMVTQASAYVDKFKNEDGSFVDENAEKNFRRLTTEITTIFGKTTEAFKSLSIDKSPEAVETAKPAKTVKSGK